MKQCCLATRVRGPQHLMEKIGNLLPTAWSVVELSDNDEIRDIQALYLDSILTERRCSNHVFCVYSSNLEVDSSDVSKIPASEYLRDIIIFNQTHWKSALCTSDVCCPLDGKPYASTLSTCAAIDLWQAALADWITNTKFPDQDLINSLSNLDVRDWLLSRAICATQNDWLAFLENVTEQHRVVALFTILAGFHYVNGDQDAFSLNLKKASDCDENYPLLQLLQRGSDYSMPSHVLVKSLERFDTEKNEITFIKKVSLLPKASPPTATRTGER